MSAETATMGVCRCSRAPGRRGTPCRRVLSGDLVLVFLPFLAWRAHVYTITTRRVIERSGLFVTRRRELAHVRGYSVQMRRGPLQRLAGSGTLILSNGVDAPMRMTRVPQVALVHEVLIDQVEVNQILAHRDGQAPPES
ncbi:MAG: PH domain-containing protein [Micrococcales bacterium]|nr:PH domain-containing protein [Micrococcales bacterium]